MTRWRVQQRTTNIIISGFQPTDDINAMIGYNYAEVKREEPASVAFTVPPDPITLQRWLNISTTPNYPLVLTQYEVVNGDLIGGDLYEGWQPPTP